MKPLARLLAASLALATLLAPAAAGAASGHHAHRARHAAPSYPMKAEEFRALMEKRIDGVRAVIDRKLDRRGVSPDRKKAIHKIFDESSKDLRAEIARVSADGTVTQGEADKVKVLTIGLRGKVRERLRAEKDPLAHAKLAKEEATKKEKAAKPTPKAEHHEGPAAKAKAEHPAKTASAGATKASPKAKKAPKKAPGPTKPAKAKTPRKHEQAEADPGANL